MKKFIADNLVKPFKSFPYFGRARFWLLYWAYRITGWHIRQYEWKFILDYLPPLMKGQGIQVLDVGCARNLFCFEVNARGYLLTGVDLESPVKNFPGCFVNVDICNFVGSGYDFVTCISVLEHIGDDGKGNHTEQEAALTRMIACLKPSGRLLLTCPTHEFAQGHPWHGFSAQDIENMLPINSMIYDYSERAGQLCLVIGKSDV